MGHHQHRAALLLGQPLQQLHHLAAGAGIEGGGGLIGEQQLGLRREGPGNRHPLLLAAGEVVGELIEMVGQTHGPQPLARPVAAAAVTQAAEQVSPHLHVLLSAEAAQQVVALENHADAAAQTLARRPVGAMQLLAQHPQGALLHLAQGPHQGEQRGFATTGWAREQHHLSGLNAQVHLPQHLHLGGTPPEAVTQVLHLNGWFAHHGWTRGTAIRRFPPGRHPPGGAWPGRRSPYPSPGSCRTPARPAGDP